jgi:ABC-type uncharacterized transport system ATPase component
MTDSERLARMENLINAIARKLCIDLDEGADEKQYEASFNRAINELAGGNRKALSLYMKRGGKIPIGGKSC